MQLPEDARSIRSLGLGVMGFEFESSGPMCKKPDAVVACNTRDDKRNIPGSWGPVSLTYVAKSQASQFPRRLCLNKLIMCRKQCQVTSTANLDNSLVDDGSLAVSPGARLCH